MLSKIPRKQLALKLIANISFSPIQGFMDQRHPGVNGMAPGSAGVVTDQQRRHRLHTRSGDHQAIPRVHHPSHWAPGPAQCGKSKLETAQHPPFKRNSRMGMESAFCECCCPTQLWRLKPGKELPPRMGMEQEKGGMKEKRNRSETTREEITGTANTNENFPLPDDHPSLPTLGIRTQSFSTSARVLWCFLLNPSYG